jgi:hypothetical protein
MDRQGVIAPDPSPQRTKTPTFQHGMNSRNEWTVFRETMSFYGAAQIDSSESNTTERTSVRVAVSTSFVLTGADRLIGVWCIRL